MKKEFNHQKVAILIDDSNLFLTIKDKGLRINYERLLERVNHRQVVRAILYHVERNRENEAGLLKKIKSLGYEVKTKPLKIYADGTMKGDMDMELAIDAVCLASKVDVIVICSGDGDYVALVHYLKSRGVKVEAMAFRRNGAFNSTSCALRAAVDDFIPITDDMLFRPEPRGTDPTS